jgi:uncharacterized phage protein (TIGR01671 family)
MREIKFRGKRLDTGEWVYGVPLVTSMSGVYMVNSKQTVRKKRSGGVSIGDDVVHHEVDPKTIGQYTGLKDENGQEIYEGDIVCDSLGVGVVSFILEHCAYFVETSDPAKRHYMLSHGQLDNTKVIGNIHDNPDLLEGK